MNHTTDPQWVIKADNLTKRFGDFIAVESLNLYVPKGHIYGFLGPNGCGKSTTIRMLTGLLTPSEGNINVMGLAIPKQAEALRHKIGYMTQKFSLYDDLTVKENLQFIGRIYGIDAQECKKRIDQLQSTYKLNQYQHQLAGTLSGGQRQRLALACACLNQPKLLFLDEPTSAVDPQNRRDFWEQLFDLSEQGTSILVTTHYMDEAERCHKIAIMEKGTIKADDTPKTLMDNINAHVVEITTTDLRQLKQALSTLAEIQSAAQLGHRLRVLVSKHINDPICWVMHQCQLHHRPLQQQDIRLVTANLEDVFVSHTGQNPNLHKQEG
ncbi:ABC transporter ATP-binding protein [Shewanella inventionis]|uniref:ABC transporter ATP-binding protein n=1 Tax=Shewanella inventionis TaxID=1738770 RepID=A0ABQ1IM39_9GAMM|nr:ABC transporter ATP-binding protein [Shewanella inventionis]MCL1156531.1 ABC transporter ATP-binding protein [Shewanella inventionis]UAL44225.1 ABC transporter ATP-binding protein [Shewanella inventionis]GGB46242.1 ABC transporter ATP-binding protein [Shewanella inventionis]